MNIHQIRQKNLIKQIGAVEKHGAVANFARENNLDPTYIRQIINGHRTMGEKSARNFEQALKLKPGTLDKETSYEINEPIPTYRENSFSTEAKAVAAAFDNVSPDLQEGILRMLGILHKSDDKKQN